MSQNMALRHSRMPPIPNYHTRTLTHTTHALTHTLTAVNKAALDAGGRVPTSTPVPLRVRVETTGDTVGAAVAMGAAVVVAGDLSCTEKMKGGGKGERKK